MLQFVFVASRPSSCYLLEVLLSKIDNLVSVHASKSSSSKQSYDFHKLNKTCSCIFSFNGLHSSPRSIGQNCLHYISVCLVLMWLYAITQVLNNSVVSLPQSFWLPANAVWDVEGCCLRASLIFLSDRRTFTAELLQSWWSPVVNITSQVQGIVFSFIWFLSHFSWLLTFIREESLYSLEDCSFY